MVKNLLKLTAVMLLLTAMAPANAQVIKYLDGHAGFPYSSYDFNGVLSNAKALLQSDGFTVTPTTTLDPVALSGACTLYIPLSADFGTYPLSNTELGQVQSFVMGGGSVVFQLENGFWEGADNDLFTRLGLGAHQTSSTSDSLTVFPNPADPILNGPHGTVTPFIYSPAVGHLDALGSLTSLINDTGGQSMLPYLPKGALGSGSGSYLFLMDVNSHDNSYIGGKPEYQVLFRNLFAYACAAPVVNAVPEPGTLAMLLGSSLPFSLLALRRRRS